MGSGDRCCGGSQKSASPPIKVLFMEHPVEAESSRCCSDSDVKADACCDDECFRSIALEECKRCCSRSVTVDEVVSGPTSCGGTKKAQSAKEKCCSLESISSPQKRRTCCKPADDPASAGNKTPTDSEKGCCSTVDATECDAIEAKAEPCPSHLKYVRRRYSHMFGELGCMCKALIAQGLESCCTTKRKLSPERIRNAPTSRARAKCCSSKASGSSTAYRSKVSAPQSLHLRKTCKAGCKDFVAETTEASSCRTGGRDCGTICQSVCCQPPEHVNVCELEKETQSVNEPSACSTDLESGGAATQHVVLSVQGMTCTGCETKLHRSIQAIPSAINTQTSIVLSRAEFDIDPRITSVDRTLAQLERATGFVLNQIPTAGSELHIRATAESKTISSSKLPLGVLDVRAIDSDIIGISYDAKIVGARDLLERSFDKKLELAPLRPPANISAGAKHVRHVGLTTTLSAALTIPVLVFAWGSLPPNEVAYQSASLALATIVQVVVAGPFYSSALRALIFSRVIEMDLLIVLSTSAAYIFSVVAYGCTMTGNSLSTGEFFESSTLLVTLIMLGRFISALARQKAVESISITSLQPTNATIVDERGNDIQEIDSRLLQYSDVFKVLPDSRIVTDGTIVSGTSEVDESMITGESCLVTKGIGSSVVAGSLNGAGLLHVKVARLPGENTISSIVDMVDQAKLSKPKVQELADKVAGYFVPVVVAITIMVFCIWIGIAISVRHQSGSDAAVKALTYAIAVLIVSCPCAVGLAVPMVIVISSGIGAEHGVVFKSAQSIESSWKATHVVFDKTGTLTQGNAAVIEEQYLDCDSVQVRSLLLGLVSSNKHPNSAALTKHLTEQGVEKFSMDFLETVVGKGVKGHHNGRSLRAGSAKWLNLEDHDQVRAFQSTGLTTLCFAIDDVPRAIYGLADTLRPEASHVASALIARGIDVSIVSGDDAGSVRSVGIGLGLTAENLMSGCSPQDKQRYIQNLTDVKNNIVIFCGDGSNDAGALAQATVGVHMSEGTDVARSASDAVLMRPDISSLLTLMDISHAAYRRIVANFVWAGIYNVFAILLAAGAFVNFRIPPEYAGLGEVVSVLPVILIALQMKWVKFRAELDCRPHIEANGVVDCQA